MWPPWTTSSWPSPVGPPINPTRSPRMSDITLVRSEETETIGTPTIVTDVMAMVGRSLRLSRRNLEVLLVSLMLPVILMLMFVYLFGGAIHTGTAYVSYVVPGVLVL